jgi:hypothetical protein
MRSGILLIIVAVIISVTGSSCKRNRFRVKISGIKTEIEIKRLEKDLFTMDPAAIPSSLPELKIRYGSFLQLFSFVINTGDINDSSFSDFLVKFCTDKLNNEVYEAVQKKYPDLTLLRSGLEDAFSHYKYYFPEKRVPALFTCITGFNNSIITGDSILGIGLDRYLGADCEYYKRLEIFKYLTERMTPENIIPDCIYGWGTSEWDFASTGYKDDNVLSEMIHEGKLKYFEKCMLPETSDELIFGFKPDQMKFCRNNEAQMWHYLIENNLLFITDKFTIRKLTGEAPFTSFYTHESPGRAAVWTGYRIVESYMKKNSGISLPDLMKNTDIQDKLQKAKYNP